MTRLASLALLACLALGAAPSAPVAAQTPSPDAEAALGVIPRPRRLDPGAGTFELGPRTVIWTDAASAATGRQLARYLERGTGLALPLRSGGTAPGGEVIELRRDRALAGALGTEGYRLSVRPGRVAASAPNEAGLFYAVQTMRQLLPPAALRDAPLPGVRWTMPAVEIEDAPRFAWRGAHLDVVRHLMPKEFVEKYVDLLALHKMNTFHWHLTDDQGWRLWDEILEGGLAPGATVMSWRGIQGGIDAARAGHDVVMAPGNWTYLDKYQSPQREREPLAIGGFLPVDTVYAYEPVPQELDASQARHVLGVQAQLWTEYIPTPKQAEYMAFPRMAALAEVLWTPRERKDLAGFRARLARHLPRLEALDVNYRRDP